MTTQLIKLNSLSLNANNIWVDLDNNSDFGYSDGADEEHYLINVLNNANDISLDSAELRKSCRDWVADYHLSAVRANLLKSINISPAAKILEVGCGCGALTRYLGEQGFSVDAVEGSAQRADISALRCRDLDNVQIIQHNFNTLDLPDGHYDAVLFIGVLEYARRFIDTPNLTPEQAVIELINRAAASLSGNGVIIVAIENRTGLKYINGAYEDHLALPEVGINNYEGYEFTGIKTYDNAQWQKIIDDTGLNFRLFFPFADYKFPNLVINDGVDEKDVAYLSSQIRSQDPISPWIFPAAENQQWSRVLSSGSLSLDSNSFGLVIAKTTAPLKCIFKNKWTLFDNVEIKPEYRINKTSSDYDNCLLNNNKLRQIINNSLAHKTSLAIQWQALLSKTPEVDTLVQLSSQLAALLKHDWPQQKLVDFEQIFIANSRQQLDYARFWLTQTSITVDQQLFHFLLGFFTTNQKLLSGFAALNYLSVSDLIQTCLISKYSTSTDITDLAEHEDGFRLMTQIAPTAVSDKLAFIICNHDKYQFRHINAQIFWSSQAETFAADQSMATRIKQTTKLQTLFFNGIDSTHRYLRFDPCDHEYGRGHFFCLHSIRITSTENHTILDLQKKAFSDYLSGSHDLDLVSQSRFIFKVSGIDAQIKFSLPAELTKITDRYNLEIKLQWLGL